MAPSYVTWQSAWHLARRHRSWHRARKYPQDTFLSARFFSVVFTYRASHPPPFGNRRRPTLLSGHPARPAPATAVAFQRSAELARPARLPRLGRSPPTACPLPTHCRRAPAPTAPSPATALPARHRPATAPAPAPAAPSPAAARPLPAHCRPVILFF
jgi:hypothetical protein